MIPIVVSLVVLAFLGFVIGIGWSMAAMFKKIQTRKPEWVFATIFIVLLVVVIVPFQWVSGDILVKWILAGIFFITFILSYFGGRRLVIGGEIKTDDSQ